MEKQQDKIRLEIDLHAYKRIAYVIRDHKCLLYRLKINELLKKSLLKDIDIIRSILEKSETKPKEVQQCIQST
jgi:type II secretory pathway component PulC